MNISAKLCRDSALVYGCDTSTVYMLKDLDPEFAERNAATLAHEKGAGFFIWKPQVIIQEMAKANEGDIILYTDAGIEIVSHVRHLIKHMDSFCLLFGGLWKQHDWCKGDALIPGEYNQLNAAAMVFRVCDESFTLVNEWLELCQTPGLIDNSPSVKPNHPGFQEHRWDQALLTTLQHLMEIQPHWWPGKVGEATAPRGGYTDTYPVIFNHHRRRNEEF